MQNDCCEYCKHSLGDTIYSIPMNKECTRWSGMFCSQECRLNGNRYQTHEPYRSMDNYKQREQWILQLGTMEILENKKKIKQ